jgi:SAM-dependent methyltransferase
MGILTLVDRIRVGPSGRGNALFCEAGGRGVAEERLRPDTHDDAELLFHWHRYQAAAPLGQGRVVLDVGCGDGYGARHLANLAAEVEAVDVDAAAVERAHERYGAPNLAFRHASATSLPYRDRTFDLVVAFEVLEHLEQSAQREMLRECARVLKSDGILLLSTPDHARTQQFEAPNPHHLHELGEDELLCALGAEFSHVRLWRQELTAGSLLWEPEGGGHEALMWAVAVDGHGSAPAPPGVDTHLTLVAAAGRDAGAVAAVRLDGYLTERSRRLLGRLWREAEDLRASLDATRAEVDQLRALQQEWQEERAAMWRDNHILAKRVLESERLEQELQARRSELDQMERDNRRLRERADRLAVIEASKGWRLVSGYWRMVDRVPLLHRIRHPLRRAPDPPPPPS